MIGPKRLPGRSRTSQPSARFLFSAEVLDRDVPARPSPGSDDLPGGLSDDGNPRDPLGVRLAPESVRIEAGVMATPGVVFEPDEDVDLAEPRHGISHQSHELVLIVRGD